MKDRLKNYINSHGDELKDAAVKVFITGTTLGACMIIAYYQGAKDSRIVDVRLKTPDDSNKGFVTVTQKNGTQFIFQNMVD